MNIIDINSFSSINNSKEYFLDTNVLYWYVYPRYGLTKKILDNCVSTNHTNIISDDNDFTTFSGINLYTANVLSLADH